MKYAVVLLVLALNVALVAADFPFSYCNTTASTLTITSLTLSTPTKGQNLSVSSRWRGDFAFIFALFVVVFLLRWMQNPALFIFSPFVLQINLQGQVSETVSKGQVAVGVLFLGVPLHQETDDLSEGTHLPCGPGAFQYVKSVNIPDIAPDGESCALSFRCRELAHWTTIRRIV